MSEVTARDLKIALAKKHRTEFFLTEVKNGPTMYGGHLQFDAVAIYKSWAHPKIVGYEIKVSRSDFLKDNKYSLYLPYFHEFYFITPTGLVQRQEVENDIGLIWYNPEKGSLTTKKRAVYRNIEIDAAMLLYIIMYRLENDRIPFYSKKAEYFKDWLKNKISNQELAWHVKSKLLDQVRELESEIRRLSRAREDLEAYQEVLKVMQKHGLNTWYNPAEKLDEALSRPYPRKLDDAFIQLDAVLRKINEVRAQMTDLTEAKAMEG
jgi:hypothetical protein